MLRFAPGLLLMFVGIAAALSPLSTDDLLYDGEVTTLGRAATVTVSIAPGHRPAGFYLAVEGIEEFSVAVNDIPVKEVSPGRTPRTISRTLDLSEHAGLLRPGENRLAVHTRSEAAGFRLRAWTSERAWYLSGLHAHTTHSDGRLTVDSLLRRADAFGARAYALTDHNTLEQCYDPAFRPVGDLQPVRGTEWTHPDSGHANVLGLEGRDSIPWLGSIHDMIDEAKWRGGLVQINHPCYPGNWEWARRPLLDPGIDMIEVFHSATWYPPGGPSGDSMAIEWWQDLLAAGRTIAGVGNPDFHHVVVEQETIIIVDVLNSCSFIRAPSNEPDSILKYAKLGNVLALESPDAPRIWLYADTNHNGAWDLVMGEHYRIPSGTRTVRFRLEVEDARGGDLVRVYDRSGLFYSRVLWSGGDFSHEWSRTLSSTDRDFFRVELHATFGLDYRGVTNPIYVNHPDYELGPVQLQTRPLGWPDTLQVGREDTLRFSLGNLQGYSPYRYAVLAAFDSELFEVIAWQSEGRGIGMVRRRDASGHAIIEWQGGYEWRNRLSPGTEFDFWLTVRPKGVGSTGPPGGVRQHYPVLFAGRADDRFFEIDNDPAAGDTGPEGRYWHRLFIPVEATVGTTEEDPEPGKTLLRVTGVGRGRLPAELIIAADEPAHRLVLRDAAGRAVEQVVLTGLVPGPYRFLFAPGSAGVYYLCLETVRGNRISKTVLVR